VSCHLRHPEARADHIREQSAKRGHLLENGSWRWPFGWVVFLYQKDGTVRGRDARTYEEAVQIRDDEMFGDFAMIDYEKAWIVMKQC
jgi:hypothetical protein